MSVELGTFIRYNQNTSPTNNDVPEIPIKKINLDQLRQTCALSAEELQYIQQEKSKSQDQIDMDKIIANAPELVRPLVKRLLVDYYRKPNPAKFKAIIGYLKDVDQFNIGVQKKQDIPTYQRPDWLAPKQIEIVDLVTSDVCVSIDGDRQTGKDTAVFTGIFERLITKPQAVYFAASKITTAVAIINKVLKEKRFEYVHNWIQVKLKEKVVFKTLKEGQFSELNIIDTTEAAVKGITGYLWMDDIDTIIKNHREDVITAAIAITRSNSDLHFVFTSNMGKGAYIELMDTFHRWEDKIQCVSLTKEDVTHIAQRNDDFLFDVMTALSGEATAAAQLRNQYNAEGDKFDPQALSRAISNYPAFIARADKCEADYVKMAIDPSGTGHPIGWYIGAYNKDNDFLWELDSGEIKLGSVDEITREIWTQDKLESFLFLKARQYGVQRIIIESNSNGGALSVSFTSAGFKVDMRNFGSNTAPNSHEAYIAVTASFYNNNRIVIRNKELKKELGRYDPAANKNECKGDVADAHLHCNWELVGGLNYLRNKQKKEQQQKLNNGGKRRAVSIY